MKIKYFPDTDTALIEFSAIPPVETKELNENIYLDLDQRGRVVSMTIEHTKKSADINEFSYQQMPALVPAE